MLPLKGSGSAGSVVALPADPSGAAEALGMNVAADASAGAEASPVLAAALASAAEAPLLLDLAYAFAFAAAAAAVVVVVPSLLQRDQVVLVLEAKGPFAAVDLIGSSAKSWELLGVSINWYLICHARALFGLIYCQQVQVRMGQGESHLYQDVSMHEYQTACILAAQSFADAS